MLYRQCDDDHIVLHSFPTRRSSDLDSKISFNFLEIVASNFVSESIFTNSKNWSNNRSVLTCNTIILLNFIIKEYYRVSRSEEHTSELQSRGQLVCRLLLEKKQQTSK